MTSKIFGNGDNCFNADIIYNMLLVMPQSDLTNFACTCRPIHELAKTAWKVRKFEILSSSSIIKLSLFIDALRKSPAVARSVKRIAYAESEALDEHYKLYYQESARKRTAKSNLYNYLTKHTSELSFMTAAEKELCCKNIQEFGIFKISTWIPLLTLCPNTEEFHFQGEISDLCDSLFSAVLHASVNASSPVSPAIHVPHLPRLRAIKLTSRLENDADDLENFILLASIPSLRSMEISSTVIDGTNFELAAKLAEIPVSSGVERVLLNCCSISPDIIALLIEHMPMLKSFRAIADYSFWRWLNRTNSGRNIKAPNQSVPLQLCYGTESCEVVKNGVAKYIERLRDATQTVMLARGLVINCSKIPENALMVELLSRDVLFTQQQQSCSVGYATVGELSIRTINVDRILQARRLEHSPKESFMQRIKQAWITPRYRKKKVS